MKKPEIPGFHWRGQDLFTAEGVRAASVVGWPFDFGSAHAFIFMCSGAGLPTREVFETKKSAYAWIAKNLTKVVNGRV